MELKVKIHNVYNTFKRRSFMPLLLEHVEDELALHGVLDELILADVSVSFFINSIPRILAKMCIKSAESMNPSNLMSDTQTVTRSSSSSIPANLQCSINDYQYQTVKILSEILTFSSDPFTKFNFNSHSETSVCLRFSFIQTLRGV